MRAGKPAVPENTKGTLTSKDHKSTRTAKLSKFGHLVICYSSFEMSGNYLIRKLHSPRCLIASSAAAFVLQENDLQPL